MIKAQYILFYAIVIFICACKEDQREPKLKEGVWRAGLILDHNAKRLIPFNMEIRAQDTSYVFTIINGEERIEVTDVAIRRDKIIFQPPVFDAQVIGEFTDDFIDAKWFNYARKEDYIVDFRAEYNKTYRFKPSPQTLHNISGKWEVHFTEEDGKEFPAVGIFKQEGAKVTGTFLTETGDYRYLYGCMDADTLFLSCFDGAHAFLFQAVLKGEELIGEFWSGIHYHANWKGSKNAAFKLSHPDSITYVANDKQIDFSFPNLSGDTISLNDERFKDKVVIIQIMGSWCPNCKDETAWLSDLYKEHHNEGLEIVALAYEKARDNALAVQKVKRLKEHYNVEYDFLIAGKANKKKAAEDFNMLNNITSFPTTLFIDRKGKVRKVHTGFNGPGTGEAYVKFKKEYELLVGELLLEKAL